MAVEPTRTDATTTGSTAATTAIDAQHGALMSKTSVALALLLLLSACGKKELSNKELMYGESGLPKNCRAIIAANIEGWQSGVFTAPEAFGSIDRNCGRFGYAWEQ